jgi:hypothetical protein
MQSLSHAVITMHYIHGNMPGNSFFLSSKDMLLSYTSQAYCVIILQSHTHVNESQSAIVTPVMLTVMNCLADTM